MSMLVSHSKLFFWLVKSDIAPAADWYVAILLLIPDCSRTKVGPCEWFWWVKCLSQSHQRTWLVDFFDKPAAEAELVIAATDSEQYWPTGSSWKSTSVYFSFTDTHTHCFDWWLCWLRQLGTADRLVIIVNVTDPSMCSGVSCRPATQPLRLSINQIHPSSSRFVWKCSHCWAYMWLFIILRSHRHSPPIMYFSVCEALIKVASHDPCAVLTCTHGSQCVSDDGLTAVCRCPTMHCNNNNNGGHVCGSDGNDYVNECEMRRSSCQQKNNIHKKYDGYCGKPWPVTVGKLWML